MVGTDARGDDKDACGKGNTRRNNGHAIGYSKLFRIGYTLVRVYHSCSTPTMFFSAQEESQPVALSTPCTRAKARDLSWDFTQIATADMETTKKKVGSGNHSHLGYVSLWCRTCRTREDHIFFGYLHWVCDTRARGTAV